MGKYVVVGIIFVIFFAGLGVILSNHSVGFSDLMRSLSDLNPRVLGLLALPFIAALFLLWLYLRKRSEDRMWKKALKDTRARKQR